MFGILRRAGSQSFLTLISDEHDTDTRHCLDEVDGAVSRKRRVGWQDRMSQLTLWRKTRELRLGGRVLQLQGVGDTCKCSFIDVIRHTLLVCLSSGKAHWCVRYIAGLLHTSVQG